MFGALPDNAVQIHAGDTSMVSLIGLYIDPDGIVYNPDGSVNEAATALAARAAVTANFARQNPNAPAPWLVEQQSVQEQSAADAERAYIDAQMSNLWETASALPGQLYDTVANAVPTGVNLAKWAVVGLVAWAVIKTMDRVPSQGHVKRYARRKIREYRRSAARYVAGG